MQKTTFQTTQELDRETIPEYNIVIKATENCSWSNADAFGSSIYAFHNRSEINKIIQQNGGLVRVTIFVEDINDNAPQFASKVFSGGVTTSANFGSKVLTLNATDSDFGANARVSYYLIGDIRHTLSEGLDHLHTAPFLIEAETGDILLNFDPQKGMRGYFDFTVICEYFFK